MSSGVWEDVCVGEDLEEEHLGSVVAHNTSSSSAALFNVQTRAAVTASSKTSEPPQWCSASNAAHCCIVLDAVAHIFNAACTVHQASIHLDHPVLAAAWAGNTEFLVLADNSGMVHLFDAATRQALISQALIKQGSSDRFLDTWFLDTDDASVYEFVILSANGNLFSFSNIHLAALRTCIDERRVSDMKAIKEEISFGHASLQCSSFQQKQFTGSCIVDRSTGETNIILWTEDALGVWEFNEEGGIDFVDMLDISPFLDTSTVMECKAATINGSNYLLILDDTGNISLWLFPALVMVKFAAAAALSMEIVLAEDGQSDRVFCLLAGDEPEEGEDEQPLLAILALPTLQTSFALKTSNLALLLPPSNAESLLVLEGRLLGEPSQLLIREGDAISFLIRVLEPSVPRDRFYSLLQKGKYDEALKLTQEFEDLDAHTVHEVRVTDLLDRISSHYSDGDDNDYQYQQRCKDMSIQAESAGCGPMPEELMAALDSVADLGVVVQSVLSAAFPTAANVRDLLTYAEKRLSGADCTSAEDDEEVASLSADILAAVNRLTTFQLARRDSFSGAEWQKFLHGDLLQVLLDAVSGGLVDEATVLWFRHFREYELQEHVIDVLEALPMDTPSQKYIGWLQGDLIPTTMRQDHASVFLWVRERCVYLERTEPDMWPGNALSLIAAVDDLLVGYGCSENTNSLTVRSMAACQTPGMFVHMLCGDRIDDAERERGNGSLLGAVAEESFDESTSAGSRPGTASSTTRDLREDPAGKAARDIASLCTQLNDVLFLKDSIGYNLTFAQHSSMSPRQVLVHMLDATATCELVEDVIANELTPYSVRHSIDLNDMLLAYIKYLAAESQYTPSITTLTNAATPNRKKRSHARTRRSNRTPMGWSNTDVHGHDGGDGDGDVDVDGDRTRRFGQDGTSRSVAAFSGNAWTGKAAAVVRCMGNEVTKANGVMAIMKNVSVPCSEDLTVLFDEARAWPATQTTPGFNEQYRLLSLKMMVLPYGISNVNFSNAVAARNLVRAVLKSRESNTVVEDALKIVAAYPHLPESFVFTVRVRNLCNWGHIRDAVGMFDGLPEHLQIKVGSELGAWALEVCADASTYAVSEDAAAETSPNDEDAEPAPRHRTTRSRKTKKGGADDAAEPCEEGAKLKKSSDSSERMLPRSNWRGPLTLGQHVLETLACMYRSAGLTGKSSPFLADVEAKLSTIKAISTILRTYNVPIGARAFALESSRKAVAKTILQKLVSLSAAEADAPAVHPSLSCTSLPKKTRAQRTARNKRGDRLGDSTEAVESSGNGFGPGRVKHEMRAVATLLSIPLSDVLKLTSVWMLVNQDTSHLMIVLELCKELMEMDPSEDDATNLLAVTENVAALAQDVALPSSLSYVSAAAEVKLLADWCVCHCPEPLLCDALELCRAAELTLAVEKQCDHSSTFDNDTVASENPRVHEALVDLERLLGDNVFAQDGLVIDRNAIMPDMNAFCDGLRSVKAPTTHPIMVFSSPQPRHLSGRPPLYEHSRLVAMATTDDTPLKHAQSMAPKIFKVLCENNQFQLGLRIAMESICACTQHCYLNSGVKSIFNRYEALRPYAHKAIMGITEGLLSSALEQTGPIDRGLMCGYISVLPLQTSYGSLLKSIKASKADYPKMGHLALLGVGISLFGKDQAFLNQCLSLRLNSRWKARLSALGVPIDPDEMELRIDFPHILEASNFNLSLCLELASEYGRPPNDVYLEYVLQLLITKNRHVVAYTSNGAALTVRPEFQDNVRYVTALIETPQQLVDIICGEYLDLINPYHYERLEFAISVLGMVQKHHKGVSIVLWGDGGVSSGRSGSRSTRSKSSSLQTQQLHMLRVIKVLSHYLRVSSPSGAEQDLNTTLLQKHTNKVQQQQQFNHHSIFVDEADVLASGELGDMEGEEESLMNHHLANARLPFHHLVFGDPLVVLKPELSNTNISKLLPLAKLLRVDTDDLYITLIEHLLGQDVAPLVASMEESGEVALLPCEDDSSSASLSAGTSTRAGIPGRLASRLAVPASPLSQKGKTRFGYITNYLSEIRDLETGMACSKMVADALPLGRDKVETLRHALSLAERALKQADSVGAAKEAAKAEAAVSHFKSLLHVTETRLSLSARKIVDDAVQQLVEEPDALIRYLFEHYTVGEKAASLASHGHNLYPLVCSIGEANGISAEDIRQELVMLYLKDETAGFGTSSPSHGTGGPATSSTASNTAGHAQHPSSAAMLQDDNAGSGGLRRKKSLRGAARRRVLNASSANAIQNPMSLNSVFGSADETLSQTAANLRRHNTTSQQQQQQHLQKSAYVGGNASIMGRSFGAQTIIHDTIETAQHSSLSLHRAIALLRMVDLNETVAFLVQLATVEGSSSVTLHTKVRACIALFSIAPIAYVSEVTHQPIEKLHDHFQSLYYLSQLSTIGIVQSMGRFKATDKLSIVKSLLKNHSTDVQALQLAVHLCLDNDIFDLPVWAQLVKQLRAQGHFDVLASSLVAIAGTPELWYLPHLEEYWVATLEHFLMLLDGGEEEALDASVRLILKSPLAGTANTTRFIDLCLDSQKTHLAILCALGEGTVDTIRSHADSASIQSCIKYLATSNMPVLTKVREVLEEWA